jgi:hypothetical protein
MVSKGRQSRNVDAQWYTAARSSLCSPRITMVRHRPGVDAAEPSSRPMARASRHRVKAVLLERVLIEGRPTLRICGRIAR